MARINFAEAQVPSVQPQLTPPPDYEHIQTNPREFGAGLYAGVERLGAGATEVSKQYGQLAAEDQVNKVVTRLDDLQSKMLSLRGADAMEQQDSIRQQMGDALNQARGNLFTADQIATFNQQTRFLYSRADRTVVDFANQQQKEWGVGVQKATSDRAMNAAAVAAAGGNLDEAEIHTQGAVNAAIEGAKLQYGQDLDPAIRDDVAQKARAQSLRLQTTAMIPTNPAGAKQLLDRNAQYFNPLEYEALSQRLQGHMAAAVGAQVNADAWGGAASQGGGTGGRAINNPGNIRPAGSSTGFMSYASPQEGYNAISQNLDAYADRGINTLAGVISRWAPPSENPTAALVANASQRTGLPADQPLNLRDPDTKQRLISAIVQQEQGHPGDQGMIQKAAGAPNLMAAMSQQPPGLADIAGQQDALAQQYAGAQDRILADPRLADNPAAQQHAMMLAEQRYRAENLRLTSQMQAITERRNATADTYIQKAMQGQDPSSLINQVAQDPNLDEASRLHLWDAIDRHAKQSDPTVAYGSAFWPLYQRITAPQGGMLQPLTDPSVLYRHAGPDGDLTLAGVQELNKTMAAMRRPEMAGDTKLQAGALAYAKHQLSFEADYGTFKVRDPKGEDQFNIGFLPAFMQYWQKGIQAGESPTQLVAKDQIDKLVAPYKRPSAELMADQLAAGTEAAVPQQAGPPAGALAYLRAHPDLRPAFDQKYGAGMADKVLGPQPPMAH